jgi:hypothetical protein
MKVVEFKEKQYKIPQNWQEVSLKNVIDTQELSDLLPDAPIIAILAGYTGIDTEDLKGAKVTELQEILESLEFIYVDYVPVPSNEFVFNGNKYQCAPDLQEILFEDWVSCQTILYRYKDNPIKGLSRLIAVMCKIEGETLDSFNIDERSKELESMCFASAKNLESFFLANLLAYKAVSQLSFQIPELEKTVLLKFKELEDIMKQRRAELGFFSPTRLVIGIYLKYLIYLRKEQEKYLLSVPTNPSKKSWIQTLKASLMMRLGRSK